MGTVESAWSELCQHLREIEVLSSVTAVVHWDRQTMMPPAGASNRGEQSALMSRIVHERLADPRVGEWLDQLRESEELTEVQKAAVRNIGRSYANAVKVPGELVERLGAARGEGFGAWVAAKESGDFNGFAPILETLFDLVVERSAAIDSDRPAYEVLLEDFNPGTNLAVLEPTFDRLAVGLREFIQAVSDVEPMPKLSETFDVERQQKLMRQVAGSVGYDFDGGRLDKAPHPFTISLGPGDVRITNRLYDDDLLGGLGGTVHEAGHGMYEQGLPNNLRGTSVNSAASLGLHESQSRFWENYIGRSQPFFEWMMGPLKSFYPESSLSAQDLYRAANRVTPSLVRVTSDEVTYNIHIIIRFEIEKDLFSGRLKTKDLPDAWNDKYEHYLGVRPSNATEGVLQDVHWSGAAFGYFPSYTIGNLYAASLGATLSEQQPDLWQNVAAGHFTPILSWLRENIHSKGHLLDAPDRMKVVVGERDSVEDLLSYLWGRHGAIHGLKRPSA
jgi:carboxypeptidase Taq